jgi:hypothetical protein
VVASGEVVLGVVVLSPGVVVLSVEGAVSGVVVAPGVAPASLAAPVDESLDVPEAESVPVDWLLLRWPQAAIRAVAAHRGIQILVFMGTPYDVRGRRLHRTRCWNCRQSVSQGWFAAGMSDCVPASVTPSYRHQPPKRRRLAGQAGGS